MSVTMKSASPRASRRGVPIALAWACAWCTLGVGLIRGSSWANEGGGRTRSSVPAARRGLDRIVQPSPRAKAIEEVRLGDRVLAGNPEATPGLTPEVDPSTWRRVTLLLPKGEENRFEVDVALLRPREWVERV